MSTRDLRIGDELPDDMAREQDLEATRDALEEALADLSEARALYLKAADERAEARTQLAYWRSKSAQQGAELAELREAYAALLASRPSELETLLRASLEPSRMAMGNVSRSPVRAAVEALAGRPA